MTEKEYFNVFKDSIGELEAIADNFKSITVAQLINKRITYLKKNPKKEVRYGVLKVKDILEGKRLLPVQEIIKSFKKL
jgi:hypothetical protein